MQQSLKLSRDSAISLDPARPESHFVRAPLPSKGLLILYPGVSLHVHTRVSAHGLLGSVFCVKVHFSLMRPSETKHPYLTVTYISQFSDYYT